MNNVAFNNFKYVEQSLTLYRYANNRPVVEFWKEKIVEW